MLRRENYLLRDMQETDLERVLEWRNSERIRKNMYTDQIITLEEHRAWFARLSQDKTADCKIFEFQGRPVGVVNFTAIDRRNNKCYWGFYLGETELPPGTGLVMGFLGLEYAFKKLGMHKVCGEALAFNLSSIKFHKKLGFIEEGRFVAHIFKHGKYEDVIPFGLFSEEWQKNKPELEKVVFFKGESNNE